MPLSKYKKQNRTKSSKTIKEPANVNKSLEIRELVQAAKNPQKAPFRTNIVDDVRQSELMLLDKLARNQESYVYGEAKNSATIDEGINQLI